jgi:carbon-monoxide dehydrogenase large subunit
MAAGDLGIDRVEFRRRNLIAESEMPYALAKVVELDLDTATDSGDYRHTFERCLTEIGWAAKAPLQGKLIDGRYHGMAIGCYFEGGASGPREHARLMLESDGTVSVHVGSSANGQGLETAFAQIAADALEMSMARIRGIFHGSTDLLPQGFGTYSSRSIVMGGSAILAAAAKLREMMRGAAARRLGCDAKEVEIVEGEARVLDDGLSIGRSAAPAGTARKFVPLSEIATDGLIADGTYASPHRTYSYGAHVAHVAVDPATGHVEVLDYVAVEDVGRIINPAMLHGQAIGAIVQGLGGVFLEHLVYDEQGQLLTGSLADYLMPSAGDFCVVRAVALEEKPAPHNPLGAKGAGEGGIIPVGGVIANAVAAALRPLGVEPRELPLSPPRVWEMITAARGP